MTRGRMQGMEWKRDVASDADHIARNDVIDAILVRSLARVGIRQRQTCAGVSCLDRSVVTVRSQWRPHGRSARKLPDVVTCRTYF